MGRRTTRSELPNAGLVRMLKNYGALRVSKDAVEALRTVVQDFVGELTRVALEFAKTGGRKTLKASDIKAAAAVLKRR